MALRKRSRVQGRVSMAAVCGVALGVVGISWLPSPFAAPSALGGKGDFIAAQEHTVALATTGIGPQASSVGAPKPRPAPAPGATKGAVPIALAAAFVFASSRGLMTSAHAEGAQPAPKPKAVRIDAFDSMRFFLIAYIVCGHFIAFAKPSAFAFKAVTQINVVVGAFFALSGYVAAYTGTEQGEKKAKDKVTAQPAPAFILARVFGYWPLHMLVLLLFSPMFIYADYTFNGPMITAWHALLSVTMTQAWFPMHAEIWNAPTWFLGALTFATMLTPYFLPVLAKQGKKELRRTALWLTLIGFLPKLAYCYDFHAWGLLEGSLAPKAFANLAMFNSLRFTPVWAVIELMLGFVACRLVMLDGTDGEPAPQQGPLATILPLVGMVGIILLRAAGIVALSDMIVRPLIFMPLFLLFLMGLHRASIKDEVTDPLAKIMALKPLTWLGGLSFPIFVVHGPLGQMFYKKVIATKLFGGPMQTVYGPWFFYVYLLIVGVAAFLLNKYFVGSKKVAEWSKNAQGKVLKLL